MVCPCPLSSNGCMASAVALPTSSHPTLSWHPQAPANSKAKPGNWTFQRRSSCFLMWLQETQKGWKHPQFLFLLYAIKMPNQSDSPALSEPSIQVQECLWPMLWTEPPWDTAGKSYCSLPRRAYISGAWRPISLLQTAHLLKKRAGTTAEPAVLAHGFWFILKIEKPRVHLVLLLKYFWTLCKHFNSRTFHSKYENR